MKDVERIAQVLTMNGINNGNVLTSLEHRGYGSDACQAMAEEIVGHIRRIVAHAVNHKGFDNSERNAVSSLLKILSKLDDVKIVKKLPDLARQKNAAIASVSFDVKAVTVDIRKEVLAWINNTLDGKELLTTGGIIADDQLAPVKKSFELLEEIKSIVADSWDTVSKAAADIASEIVKEIRNWRLTLDKYICVSEDVAGLERALEEATAWKAMYTIAEKKNEFATEEYIKEKGLPFVKDAYSAIPQVKAAREVIAAFKSRLAAYETETEKLTRLGTLRAEKERLLQEKENEERTVKAVAAQYQNGEISAERAAAVIQDSDAKKTRVAKRLAQLAVEIKRGEKNAVDREATSRKLNDFVDRITAFEMDPVKFKWLCNSVDFKQVLSVLAGRGSNEQMQKIANDIFETMVKIEKMLEPILVDTIEQIDIDLNESLGLIEEETIEQQEVETQSAEDFLKMRLAELNGGNTPTGGIVDDNDIRNDTIILSDDDK